jgi:hypothetical protein
VVSWLKIRPFLPKWGSWLFVISLIAVQPFWIAESWSNFEYFNNLGNDANLKMRPWEALVRDPWWIFTTWKLIDSIGKAYSFKVIDLVKINQRFGVMLACMFISIAFLLTDVIVSALHHSAASGINPYWRFALVFKCASDTIFLDDFKKVIDGIVARKFSSAGGTAHRGGEPHHHRKLSTTLRDNSKDNGEYECGPVTNISSPQPAAHHNYPNMNPWATRTRDHAARLPPQIHVQKETTVTTELRKKSHESFNSDQKILPEIPPTMYSQNNSSTGSLSINYMSSERR